MEKALVFLKDLLVKTRLDEEIVSEHIVFDINEAIAELEAQQKLRQSAITCEGCKYQMHTINDVQYHGNWMKYSVFYDCINDKSCKRNTTDRYEPKDNA